eukprot:10210-Prorocentrum_minimum.AAC.5
MAHVYTFVEEPAKPGACTVLIKGQNDHSIAQIKEAVRDGLRAVNNVINDAAVVQGAGAFEVAAADNLRKNVMATVQVWGPLNESTPTKPTDSCYDCVVLRLLRKEDPTRVDLMVTRGWIL